MSHHSPNLASPEEIERLLHHMPTVASLAENDWSKGFARPVMRQAHRRSWKPPPKQLPVMRALVSDLFTHDPGIDQEGDIQLIE